MAGHAPAVIVEVWEDANLTFRYSRLEMPQTPAELRRLCYLALASAEQEIDSTIKRANAWGAAQFAHGCVSATRNDPSVPLWLVAQPINQSRQFGLSAGVGFREQDFDLGSDRCDRGAARPGDFL